MREVLVLLGHRRKQRVQSPKQTSTHARVYPGGKRLARSLSHTSGSARQVLLSGLGVREDLYGTLSNGKTLAFDVSYIEINTLLFWLKLSLLCLHRHTATEEK